jgi:hypothetical protein
MAKKVTGARCLTTQGGNILAFIPANQIDRNITAGLVQGDQWIYMDPKGKWLKHPKVEIGKNKPVNQVEWAFLMEKAGDSLRVLTEKEVRSAHQAILVREVHFKKARRGSRVYSNGNKPFAEKLAHLKKKTA